MANELTTETCSRPDCSVSSTGVCADGHTPLASCPHYCRPTVPDAHLIADDEIDLGHHDITDEEEQIALPAGEALTPSDVDEFLKWRGATFIAIVGDRDSGKTTLLCALYDRFLRAPFADHVFAGSRTLLAFERRLHYSRAESGRAEPDTARTPISAGLQFLHLALAPQSRPTIRVDLMLSDRAGEVYRNARNKSAAVSELIEVMKADRVVFLLDGGRVANPAERAGALQSVRQSIRAFCDGGALSDAAIVHVVTTKVDLLADHAEKLGIEELLSNFQARLRSDFSHRCREISFWRIAARDPRRNFAPAYGLDALLRDWMEHRARPLPPARLDIPVTTEFDRLLIRTGMEVLP